MRRDEWLETHELAAATSASNTWFCKPKHREDCPCRVKTPYGRAALGAFIYTDMQVGAFPGAYVAVGDGHVPAAWIDDKPTR